jgi:hypothetical protein
LTEEKILDKARAMFASGWMKDLHGKSREMIMRGSYDGDDLVQAYDSTRRRTFKSRQTTKMTVRNILTTLVCLAATGTTTTLAAGQDVCACSPSTYEFTFDFDLACPGAGGDFPDGIAEVTCFITSFSADVKDLMPVAVRSISIIEADTERIPIAQSQIDGSFVTGDSFTYSSVAALGNATELPQSIQLTITGTNAENSSLVQVWAIKFTNDCGVYPVLEVGQSYGWTKFVSLCDWFATSSHCS